MAVPLLDHLRLDVLGEGLFMHVELETVLLLADLDWCCFLASDLRFLRATRDVHIIFVLHLVDLFIHLPLLLWGPLGAVFLLNLGDLIIHAHCLDGEGEVLALLIRCDLFLPRAFLALLSLDNVLVLEDNEMGTGRGEGPHVVLDHGADLAFEPEGRVVHGVDLVRHIVVLVHRVLPIDPVSEDPPARLHDAVLEFVADEAEELLPAPMVVDRKGEPLRRRRGLKILLPAGILVA